MTVLAELRIAAEADAWRAAGFAIDADGVGQVGSGSAAGRTRPSDSPDCGRGRWPLPATATSADVDGVPTDHLEPQAVPATPAAPTEHAIGAVLIDHVVLVTPDLPRTVAAVERGLGLPLLRTRDTDTHGVPTRQAFFRMGEVILEVVGGTEPDAGGGPARFYGIAVTVDDLDAAVARLGDRIGRPKVAVQRNRSIATIRLEAGLAVPVALMSAAPTS